MSWCRSFGLVCLCMVVSCLLPTRDDRSIQKNALYGTWAVFMRTHSYSQTPTYDARTRRYLMTDTLRYSDTTCPQYMLFDERFSGTCNRYSADLTPVHPVFLSEYEFLRDTIFSPAGTLAVSRSGVGFCFDHNGDKRFVHPYLEPMPPPYWEGHTLDTQYVCGPWDVRDTLEE